MTKSTHKKFKEAVLFGFVCAVFQYSIMSWTPDIFETRLLAQMDSYFLTRGPRPPPENVVIVHVPLNSASQSGNRDAIAEVRKKTIGILERILKDKPKVIAIDLVPDAPSSDPAVDQRLAELIAKAPTVMAVNVNQTLDFKANKSAYGALLPFPKIREAAAALGLAAFDADKAIRLFPISRDLDGITYNPISFKAAQLATGTMYQESDNRPYINFYGPYGTIPLLSLDAEEAESYGPGFFKNKIVFLGSITKDGEKEIDRDRFNTPVSSSSVSRMNGVEIHATVTGNILDGTAIYRLGAVKEKYILIGLLMLLMTAVWYLDILPGALLFAVVIAVWWNPSLYKYTFSDKYFFFPSWDIMSLLPWAYAARLLFAAWLHCTQLVRYVGKSLTALLHRSGSKIEFEEVEAKGVAIHVDLPNYTGLQLTYGRDVAKVLRLFHDEGVNLITPSAGTVFGYVADAIIATIGLLEKVKDPVHQALKIALTLRARLPELATQAGFPDVEPPRFGIAFGNLVACHIGSKSFKAYTSISETQTRSTRLESLGKGLPSGIILDANAESHLPKDLYTIIPLGHGVLKGVNHPESVYMVSEKALTENSLQLWRDGMTLFQKRQFELLPELIRKVESCLPPDKRGKSLTYIKKVNARCDERTLLRNSDLELVHFIERDVLEWLSEPGFDMDECKRFFYLLGKMDPVLKVPAKTYIKVLNFAPPDEDSEDVFDD